MCFTNPSSVNPRLPPCLACRLGRRFCFAEVSTGHPRPQGEGIVHLSACLQTPHPSTYRLPPSSQGEGIARLSACLQTPHPSTHGCPLSRLPARSALLLRRGVHRTPAPQGRRHCPPVHLPASPSSTASGPPSPRGRKLFKLLTCRLNACQDIVLPDFVSLLPRRLKF